MAEFQSPFMLHNQIEREVWQDAFEDKRQNTLILQLPVQQPDVVVPVIELFLQ